MAGERQRLDEALVAGGLAPSRSRARDMILRGSVRVDGRPEGKPARLVGHESRLEVNDPAAGYVSRGAVKLLAALDGFGFDPAGSTILDLGASTGGFTQVLLDRGAASVIAVDVGHDQLDPKVARDPRVLSLEGLNARELTAETVGHATVDALVADLSFISLKLALPAALGLVAPMGWGVLLVKPQFEVGRALIGKGGVVRDAVAVRASVDEIAAWLESQHGWSVVGMRPSPITGGDGNTEFLLGARRG